MARGGSRKGAGRKQGAPTRLNQAAREQALATGISPLDFMLTMLRDPKLPQAERFEAAKAAAPYVHARLAAIEAKHDISDALADLLKAVDGRTRGIPQSDRSVFGLAMASNQSLLDH
jgi:hypothetical protein